MSHSNLSKPLVTVLMPVYNAQEYVGEAIQSVLCQTFQDFELLIVDDGCTDGSGEIIQTFNDPRIRIITNEQNVGLIASLNRGLKEINTSYIARADADDICLPTRLEEQVAYLESHQKVGLCGTWFNNFQDDKVTSGARYAEDDKIIKLRHLYQIHVSHGTAMFRTETLKNHGFLFDSAFSHAEDYELFDRIGTVTRIANLQKVLYLVREHDKSVSKVYSEIQQENSLLVRERIFSRIGVTLSKRELHTYEDLQHHVYTQASAQDVLQLFDRIFNANQKSEVFDIDLLRSHLSSTWYHYCSTNSKWRFSGWSWFLKASFTEKSDLTAKQQLKLRLKRFLVK